MMDVLLIMMSVLNMIIYEYECDHAFCFLATVPLLNPLDANLGRFFIYLILPVPCPLLPLTFCDQLNYLILADGNPHLEQKPFYLWKDI